MFLYSSVQLSTALGHKPFVTDWSTNTQSYITKKDAAAIQNCIPGKKE